MLFVIVTSCTSVLDDVAWTLAAPLPSSPGRETPERLMFRGGQRLEQRKVAEVVGKLERNLLFLMTFPLTCIFWLEAPGIKK